MNALIRRYSTPRPAPALDQFAELISQEIGTGDAAVMMGLPRKAGKDMLKRLRGRLGWQAQ